MHDLLCSGATTRPLCANYYLIRLAVTSSHAPTAPSDHPFYSHRASPVQVPQTPPLHSTTRPSLLTISPAHRWCPLRSSLTAPRALHRGTAAYLGTACANSARLCAHEFIASSLFRKKNPKKGVTMSPVLVLVVKLANLGDIRCAR